MMKEKKVDETITKCRSKRVMTPAVDGMTVKQERSCLSEIRTNAADIKADHVLSNGWTAGNFALCYFCLLYTSPSPRDQRGSRMPSSA